MKMKNIWILFVLLPFLGVSQRFRHEIQDYPTVSGLRAEFVVPKKNDKIFIKGNEKIYYYDHTDTSTPDDGLYVLIQTGGYRWKCLNCCDFTCIPADLDTIVTGFTIINDVATIELSSGQTLTANITHPADSTVVTSSNNNLVVTETSANVYELEFVYKCDSIKACLTPLALTQTPYVVAGDTIGYFTDITDPVTGNVVQDTIFFPAIQETVTNITGTHPTGNVIGTYTNEAGTAQPIRETVTSLTTVTGGTGLPNTATFTNENGTVTTFDYISGARNNLQLGSPIVERGNISGGGGQPADFIRDIYNWMGGTYKDHWQSAGDAELVSFKAGQTINSTNTTNSGSGAVNIGTAGANGRYKLNVHGAMWLDNGRNSQFIGDQAGQNNSMPLQIGIGTRANMNSTASFNNAFGYEALMNNTTGSFNDAFGYQSMRNANGGFANLAVGSQSLYSNQGSFNVGVGVNALASNTFGFMNFGLGYNSMVLNTTGSRNIGVGYSSLYSNINGWQNIAIGGEAMQQNTSGNNNIGIGDLALQFNTSSSNNNAIGIQSQRYNLGSWNVSLGNFSQIYNRNVSYNTSVGGYTMYQNRLSNNNVAIGYESMYAINSVNSVALIAGRQYEIISQGSSDFTLVGAPNNNAGTIFTATGSTPGNGTTISITDIPNNNTAVGYQSLYATQGFSGNVALGYQAGYGTTENNLLFIENSSDSVTPLIGGNFSTDEVKIGGKLQFSISYPPSGAGVANGSMFYGTDGALYFKGGSGTITMIAPN